MDRDTILQRLETDLIGPLADEESLPSRPSDVYLSGILWPRESRMGGEEAERLGAGSADEEGGGASAEDEEVALVGGSRPCSAGISFAVASAEGPPAIIILFRCGTYERHELPLQPEGASSRSAAGWKRRQHVVQIGPIPCHGRSLEVDPSDPPRGIECTARTPHGIPPGLRFHMRSAEWNGARLVTLTAINGAMPDEAEGRNGIERTTLFQVQMQVTSSAGSTLVARPSRRAIVDDDDRAAALLYRKAREFAAGHTCSASWKAESGSDTATEVSIAWIPRAVVPAVSARGHEVFGRLHGGDASPLSAEWLASAPDAELRPGLQQLVAAYREWISLREEEIAELPEELQSAAEAHLATCSRVADRMEDGALAVTGSPSAALAFRLANRAMLMQHSWDPEKRKRGPLVWRPFQLGFFLLSAASLADRNHADRATMDLLWFPTGGGKTEAYLALIAFLAFYRRLAAEEGPDTGGGVAAVMRYTLRLLTTQQFARATAVVLACEAMRRRRAPGVPQGIELGELPFSIGLWVGGDATPNKFKDARDALTGSKDVASPAQLVACPACHSMLKYEAHAPSRSVYVRCPNTQCVLHDHEAPLPVWTVDEDVYAQRPTLLIGTIDKFAQIVRRSEVNALFAVRDGQPPDLIIQDELHLISGPLGTVAGLYETAVDQMFTRGGSRPKIIGSTATIRRAPDQVSALFARRTCQFPPPGIDAGDSGFAVEDPGAPGRLYAAVTTAGRSAKFTLQACAASLLQAAKVGFASAIDADPYWTLVTYFNSLRELGGALVLMQDDVADAISMYADRRGEEAREVKAVEELTSRRSQAEVRDMLKLIALRADEDGALDAVLASNMLSVGVDVPRLGLMLVNGQPKGIAEYIQATSRVGRQHPGLVVVSLNNAKARDRSHYETFRTWHSTLYRDVEATSVTPFASRARDRALHSVLVALVRHLVDGMLESPDIEEADPREVDSIVSELVKRAGDIDASEAAVEAELLERLDQWRVRSPVRYWDDYRPKESLLQSAERAATLRALGRSPGEPWATLNNMRNVEPSSHFRLAERLRSGSPRAGNDGENNGK